MTKNAKIILFTLIGLSMLGLVLFGLFYSKKLDNNKETAVNSNINDYIYDETKDTLDLVEEENEDLDGEEAEKEDDDFEVYDEEDDWGDEDENVAGTKSEKKSSDETKAKPTNTSDDELEELYDNSKPEEKEELEDLKEEPVKADEPIVTNSSGKYLVIVGSFGSTRNAEKKIKKLEEAGFTGEIIKLKGSKLKTVIAGRFSTEAEAEDFAKEVEVKGLRAIVKENN